jgi:hypothetical protein
MNYPPRRWPRTAPSLRQTLLRVGWVTALGISVCPSAVGANIAPQKALSVIEALETKFQVMRWTAVYGVGELSDPADSNSIAKLRNSFQRTEVIYDPVGRRYRAEMQGVCPWLDGERPYIGSCQGFSFDGEVYRTWERQKAGTELPTVRDDPGRGVISRDLSDHHLPEPLPQFAYLATGMGYMTPCFSDFDSPSQPLSRILHKWLDEGRDVTVVEDDEGAWTITTPTTYAGHEGYRLRIGYDPNKGGVITGGQWIYLGEEGEIENTRLDIELQELGGGVWVPKTVKRVSCLDRPALVKFVTYEDVQVNPPVDSTTFLSEFPRGVRVTDHIEGKTYVVTGVVDEQSAVRQFMQMHNVTGEAPPPDSNEVPPPDSNEVPDSNLSFAPVATIILSVGLLLLAALFVLRARKRRPE